MYKHKNTIIIRGAALIMRKMIFASENSFFAAVLTKAFMNAWGERWKNGLVNIE